MTQGASQPLQMVLCEEESAGRIVVGLDAFVRFDGGIDTALASLVEQWRHLQPPHTMPKRQTRPRNKSK